jgi:ring-1,2-phenylacetyl-CoA epoxidase subunit PaaD
LSLKIAQIKVLMHTNPEIWSILETIHDPEIPVLSVVDLGVVRSVNLNEQAVEIKITPTYSGCPAMDTMALDIKNALEQKGYTPVKVSLVLQPAWTTDWLSEAGKQKLLAYGIAPPVEPLANPKALFGAEPIVPCPQCGSTHTHLLSQFGSTACKALYRCADCLEPFDYFKCL